MNNNNTFYKDFAQFGNVFEEHFINFIKQQHPNLPIRKATIAEDLKGKDVIIDVKYKDKNYSSYDVKAPRKDRRGDVAYMKDYTWLEWQKPQGSKGSVVGGQQDFMVLYSPTDIYVVERQRLADFCADKISESVETHNNGHLQEFQLYQQRDNVRLFKIAFKTLQDNNLVNRHFVLSPNDRMEINKKISEYNELTTDEYHQMPYIDF